MISGPQDGDQSKELHNPCCVVWKFDCHMDIVMLIVYTGSLVHTSMLNQIFLFLHFIFLRLLICNIGKKSLFSSTFVGLLFLNDVLMINFLFIYFFKCFTISLCQRFLKFPY